MGVSISVNTSPLAGKAGSKLTLNDLKMRLLEEAENDVALTVLGEGKSSIQVRAIHLPRSKSLNSSVLGIIVLLHMYVIAGLFIAALPTKCLLFVCGLLQIITSMRPDRKWSASSDTTTRATSIYIDAAIDY